MRPEIQLALQQAATLLRQGRLDDCASICRRIVEAQPQSVDAINFLSLVSKGNGDLDEAERLMNQALALDPRRADIQANLGNLYVSLGRADDAEAAYREALAIDRRFRQAKVGLARLLLQTGRADEARREIEPLVRKDPRDAEAWNVLGSAWQMLDNGDKAERAFRRALSIKPDYTVARHNLGALLASLSRSEEALEELDRAAADGLSGAEIVHNRASALMALGRLDAAISLLREALESMPEAISLQVLLARIRYMQGDSDFTATLRQAVADYPRNVLLRIAASQALRGAERFEDARAIMQQGIDLEANDPRLLAEMSGVLQDLGELEKGLEFASRATAADPEDPALRDLQIQALLSLGRGDDAMPLIEAARRRVPLDQGYIAFEATAARLIGDPRYERFYDYERLVQSYTLPVPEGWDSIESFHADLIPVLNARHRFVAPPLNQSLRAGTQTPRGLLGDPDPVVQAFLAALDGPLEAYCNNMGSDPDHPLSARNTGKTKLIGCWSVRLHKNGFHVNHVHSKGWISSAYYVEVPDEVADAERQCGWIKFGEPRFRVPGATPEKTVQPAAGKLVLFPSYMWHGTTPLHGDAPRMTIAFDAVPA